MLDDNEGTEFEYVVERRKPAKICFGSTLPRDTTVPSSYQKRFIFEANAKVTPQSYNLETTSPLFQIQHKIRSNRGVVGLANIAPRFPRSHVCRVPSPTRYDAKYEYDQANIATVPFRNNIKRDTFKALNTPGPGEHSPSLPSCHRTKFDSNFGRPRMVPAVAVKCNPEPLDECIKCGQICHRDYWTRNDTYLCHTCKLSEARMHEIFDANNLRTFKKIRSCSFKHRHEGTSASIKLLSDTQIVQRERLENYLSIYIR